MYRNLVSEPLPLPPCGAIDFELGSLRGATGDVGAGPGDLRSGPRASGVALPHGEYVGEASDFAAGDPTSVADGAGGPPR